MSTTATYSQQVKAILVADTREKLAAMDAIIEKLRLKGIDSASVELLRSINGINRIVKPLDVV